jgi:phosphotransferase family enzyme
VAASAVRMMSFKDLAFLLLPAESGRTGTIVETDERWEPLPSTPLEQEILVWGRGSLRSGRGAAAALRWAMGRERAFRSIRRRLSATDVVRIHRIPPPRLAGGVVRERIRGAILGGAIVELSKTGGVRRVIDDVAGQAGAIDPVTSLMPGSGGSLLIRMRDASGARVLLRVGRGGTPGDPHPGASALAALHHLRVEQIPRALGRGATAGATWSTESLLPGRRPARVADALALEIARLCSALPRSDQPPTAHAQDLRSVTAAFPRWTALLARIDDEIGEVARAVPSVLRHGDLWAGNVLVRRGRLTGIVDWDAWHPSALPGVDLLHLMATGEELRARAGLGHVWRQQPWMGERFRSLTVDYWGSMRIVPNERFLHVLGLAWWASYVAASIYRLPHLAEDARWAESNVERVLKTASRGS